MTAQCPAHHVSGYRCRKPAGHDGHHTHITVDYGLIWVWTEETS